eukprot:scaffold192860_cov37-Tisochrysis_lutea.AAC.1
MGVLFKYLEAGNKEQGTRRLCVRERRGGGRRKKKFLIISPRAQPCTASLQPRPLSLPPLHLPCGTSPRALPRGWGLGEVGFQWQTVCTGPRRLIALLPSSPPGYRFHPSP